MAIYPEAPCSYCHVINILPNLEPVIGGSKYEVICPQCLRKQRRQLGLRPISYVDFEDLVEAYKGNTYK